MKITHKNKSRILPPILLLAVIAVLAVALTPRLLNQSKVVQSVQTADKAEQIAEVEARLASINDKGSQEYKEAKAQFCALRSRPAAERERAVANVREFLGMPTVDVTFDCGRGNYEYYEAAKWQFIIDPATNYIVEMGEAQRSWGTREDGTRWFDPAPESDYTPRYNAEEAGKVAEQFITDHKNIFGVDITKMTRKYEGMKDGDSNLVNYFFNWETKDENGKIKELVRVTITRGGQIVVYDNDTYDLAKNGR